MEIKKESLEEFIKRMEKRNIDLYDLIFVIESLSYMATDNGFDKEGFLMN